jgi:hypothetical protein
MDAIDFDFNEEDDLSSGLGTETLAARDMVFKGFDNTPRAHVPIRYYPIRKVVYYQAIHRPARPTSPRAPACWDHCTRQHGQPQSAYTIYLNQVAIVARRDVFRTKPPTLPLLTPEQKSTSNLH